MCEDLLETQLSVVLHPYPEGRFHLQSFEELPFCFPQRQHYFALPPVTHKGSNFSAFLSTLVIFFFFFVGVVFVVAILRGVR